MVDDLTKYQRLLSKNSTLRPVDAAASERLLLDAPNEASLRIELIKFYFLDTSDVAKVRLSHHVAWMIEHYPRLSLHGFELLFDDEVGYERCKSAWLVVLERNDLSEVELLRAAGFLKYNDPEIATSALVRAIQLDPLSSSGHAGLGELLYASAQRLLSLGALDDAVKCGNEATLRYEQAVELDASGSPSLLIRMARAAMIARRWKVASDACQVVIKGDAVKCGVEIHEAFNILGSLALVDGDTSFACTCLLKSAEVPPSRVLRSFGPSLTLAQKLLDRGLSEAVVNYLLLCTKLSNPLHVQVIEQWVTEIRVGASPVLDFVVAQLGSSETR